jgi:hypothetical protein
VLTKTKTMNPLKTFLPLFFAINTIIVHAQDYKPIQHTGKWLDGHEVSFLEKDSILVKLNFSTILGGKSIFEIEVINKSTTKDILVDPAGINGLWFFDQKYLKQSNKCNKFIFYWQDIKYPSENGYEGVTYKHIRKNTLEPNKSIFGYFFFKHCDEDPYLVLNISISGTDFSFKFSGR